MALIAIPANGPSPDDRASLSFPHAPYVHFYDPDAGTFEAAHNPAAQARAHRGMVVAKLLLKHEVTAVVGHYMGPHPVQALQEAGVPIHEGREDLSVRQVAEAWSRGALRVLPTDAPVGEHRQHGGGCGCDH